MKKEKNTKKETVPDKESLDNYEKQNNSSDFSQLDFKPLRDQLAANKVVKEHLKELFDKSDAIESLPQEETEKEIGFIKTKKFKQNKSN